MVFLRSGPRGSQQGAAAVSHPAGWWEVLAAQPAYLSHGSAWLTRPSNLQNKALSSEGSAFPRAKKKKKTSQASVACRCVCPSLQPASSQSTETGTPPPLLVTLMVILA